MKRHNYSRGLVKQVILVTAGLILLAYLGLNLREIVESKTFTDNWHFIVDTMTNLWSNYLKVPVIYVYSKILLPYVWVPIFTYIKSQL